MKQARPADRPRIDDALKREVVALYRRHAAGCCLHVMLDDHNLEQDTADWCVKYAEEHAAERGCDCAPLARKLAALTMTQRGRCAREKYEWARAQA